MNNLFYDTLDDRREIYHLLHRLPPHKRIRFVDQCCHTAKLGRHHSTIRVSHSSRLLADQARKCDRADQALTMDLYNDLWMLSTHYSFNLDNALSQLVRMVRKC